MSRRPVGERRDVPAHLLLWTAPLLPANRRQWGQAMQAELAGLETPADRWRFAGGCALAILRRPAPGALAAVVVPGAFVLATILLTARTAYLPLRLVLVAMAAVLAAVYLCGDRAALFAPGPTRSRVAGVVRAGGALTLAWLSFGLVLGMRSGNGDVVDRATAGVPIMTVVIGLYLLGFLALTSPALADRRVLTRGVGLGIVAATAWLAMALTHPPLPLSSFLGLRRPGRGDPRRRRARCATWRCGPHRVVHSPRRGAGDLCPGAPGARLRPGGLGALGHGSADPGRSARPEPGGSRCRAT